MKKQKSEKEKVVGTLKYSKKEKGRQGITLIALVVTIVVLLILAGVSIVVLFGEHGIITVANQAANDHKLAFYMDKFEVVKTSVATQNAGKVPIEKFKDALINEKVVTAEQITGNNTDGYIATPEEDVKITMKQAEDGKNVTIKYELTNENGTTGGGSGEGGGDNPGGEGTNPDDPTPPTPGTIVSDGSFSEEKGVNTPKLGEGMTAITWNGTEWVEPKTADEWYDYSTTAKKWANARTEDGSMWVWIPRYAYMIKDLFHSRPKVGEADAGKIEIKFMKGETNEAVDGTNTWDNALGEGNWNIHPGFDYDSTKTGVWIAKFKASKSDATEYTSGTSEVMTIRAGVQPWKKLTIKNAYSYCLNYKKDLNSHLMKNTEWGIALYLAQSDYGRNSEIMQNKSSSTASGKNINSLSGSTSTTYNNFGIYDMHGCAKEFVAAFVEGEDEDTSLLEGETYTMDIYAIDWMTNPTMYGDAVWETADDTFAWYADTISRPISGYFLRGSTWETNDYGHTGAFVYSSSSRGVASSDVGFRPVLAF